MKDLVNSGEKAHQAFVEFARAGRDAAKAFDHLRDTGVTSITEESLGLIDNADYRASCGAAAPMTTKRYRELR